MVKDNNEVFVFDVCGTLYHSNTTYDFLLWYHRKNSLAKFLKCRLLLSRPAKAIWILLRKLRCSYDVRKSLISTLRGCRWSSLQKESELFVREILVDKKNETLHELLHASLERGKEIFLVSASLDFIICSIAAELSVKRFGASQLEMDALGKMTGNLLQDLKGNKSQFLEEMGLDDGHEMVFATDNLDDSKLALQAGKTIIVSKKKNRMFWEKLMQTHPNWEILDV